MASHGVNRGGKENHHIGIESLGKLQGVILVPTGVDSELDVVSIN